MTNQYTQEQVAEFNRKCAEYLNILYSFTGNEVFALWPNESVPRVFNAYYDANDRNRVLEKIEIITHPCEDLWVCTKRTIGGSCISGKGDTMEAAQIECIMRVLAND